MRSVHVRVQNEIVHGHGPNPMYILASLFNVPLKFVELHNHSPFINYGDMVLFSFEEISLVSY